MAYCLNMVCTFADLERGDHSCSLRCPWLDDYPCTWATSFMYRPLSTWCAIKFIWVFHRLCLHGNGPCNRELLSQGMGVLNICILRLLMGGSHRARWCVCRTKCGVHGQETNEKEKAVRESRKSDPSDVSGSRRSDPGDDNSSRSRVEADTAMAFGVRMV